MFITVSISGWYFLQSWAAPFNSVSVRYIIILSSHLCQGIQSGLYSLLPTRIQYAIYLNQACHMPCPYHPALIDNLIMLAEEYKSWSSSFYIFSSLSVFCTLPMENFYQCQWPWHMTMFIPVGTTISKRMSEAQMKPFAWSVGFPVW